MMDRPSRKRGRPAILVHGGAWATPDGEVEEHRKGVHRASMVGYEILLMGGSALDAVQRAVEYLESDPAFNAGRGSVLNVNGQVELDAAIMDGSRLAAGAVACVSGLLHPVALAREVLEKSPHVMLAGEGALEFARAHGIATCEPEELIVERERQRYRFARASASASPGDTSSTGGMVSPGDTVGAVACDANGHVAAATSTGGALLKLPGRVGDSPIVGAGLYADDLRGAASCTGWGEGILRVVMALRAVDAMTTGIGPAEAAQHAIRTLESRTQGRGGIILVDGKGELAFAFNTPRMAHAYIHEGMTNPEVGI
jgi:beta-aspartyl-peptidase (threonine type)